jgi:hypothetical protein
MAELDHFYRFFKMAAAAILFWASTTGFEIFVLGILSCIYVTNFIKLRS